MDDTTSSIGCPCVCHCPDEIARDLARQLHDEDEAVFRRLREASWDIAAAADWGEIARRPTHAELEERRDIHTAHRPDTQPTDKAALEHWIRTGQGT